MNQAQQWKCSNCGQAHSVAPVAQEKKSKSWKAQSNTRRFEGTGHADLTQTWPPPAPRTKSVTRVRAEQSAGLGCACVACIFSLVSPLPNLVDVAIFVSASTFVLSIAFGKDNQEALFKLLDINRDGKLNMKDIEQAVNSVLDNVLEPDETRPDALQSIGDNVTYGYAVDRRMPDGAIMRSVLLPDHPRYVTKEKLKQVARLYFEMDNENFSRRQCGEPFGDDIAQVQVELERVGYIAKQGKAKNAPHKWTPAGERWLKDKFL